MILDERKMLNLVERNPKTTFKEIKSFLNFHNRAGTGEVGIKCGSNREIRTQVARAAFEEGATCHYDYIYDQGLIIVETNI
jgi:hypothetical protein